MPHAGLICVHGTYAGPTPVPTPTNTPAQTPTETPTATPTDTPVPTCGEAGPCVIFVASSSQDGAIGGLLAADAVCQAEAAANQLSGIYYAWLSDDTASPATRFTRSTEPYVLVNDTVIANNWTDLTDHVLQSEIPYDASGTAVNDEVWTSATFDSQLNELIVSFANWTSNSDRDNGDTGSTDHAADGWTSYSLSPCDDSYRLYCFQQPTTAT
jgi:hypothetical protein